MELRQALEIKRRDVVSFVGAGGKTTAMFRLARELSALGWVVCVTTTTTIYRPGPDDFDEIIVEASPDVLLHRLGDAVSRRAGGENPDGRRILVATGYLPENKLRGIEPGLVNGLARLVGIDCLLVEADGAARKPFKAPASHEPVVPSSTTVLVPVVGATAVDKPLLGEHVHRPEIVSGLTGTPCGERLTAGAIARVLLDSRGGLKDCPETARVYPLVNQADSSPNYLAAMAIAREMRNLSGRGVARDVRPPEAHDTANPGGVRVTPGSGDRRVSRLLIGQVASADPVIHSLPPAPQTGLEAAVLAAGGASRFGSPKQMAVVEGSPMISVSLRNLLEAGVSDIMVIMGASAEGMVPAIRDYPVYPVLNGQWEEGLGSSIRRAVSAAHPDTEGLLLYLGDQPWIPPGTVKLLADAFRASDALAVQPVHQGRIGHPVILRRQLFPELINLSGDTGARDVLRRHRDRVLPVPVDTPAIYLDVDLPSDLPSGPSDPSSPSDLSSNPPDLRSNPASDLDGQGRDEAT